MVESCLCSLRTLGRKVSEPRKCNLKTMCHNVSPEEEGQAGIKKGFHITAGGPPGLRTGFMKI